METVSKEKAAGIAAEIFKSYPRSKKVIVTSDGQAFIADEGDAAAKNHARNNRYKKELELYTFLRAEEKEEREKSGEEDSETQKELIAQIAAAQTKEAVQAILDNENKAEKPRKSVIEAATKKLETFKETNS
jgi:hypothetical protein